MSFPTVAGPSSVVTDTGPSDDAQSVLKSAGIVWVMSIIPTQASLGGGPAVHAISPQAPVVTCHTPPSALHCANVVTLHEPSHWQQGCSTGPATGTMLKLVQNAKSFARGNRAVHTS